MTRIIHDDLANTLQPLSYTILNAGRFIAFHHEQNPFALSAAFDGKTFEHARIWAQLFDLLKATAHSVSCVCIKRKNRLAAEIICTFPGCRV